MFGLYPAGPRWTRRFISGISAGQIRERLVEVASFTAGKLLEPFGKERGAVIASHQGFLVMVDTDLNGTDVVVVPDVHLQNLLWSVNAGFASQWSDREIKLLTGLGGWNEMLQDSSRKLDFISGIVEQAIDGRLVKPQPVESRATPQQQPGDGEFPGDESWIPSDYDYLVPVTQGDAICVH
jgi:hypothetical protein